MDISIHIHDATKCVPRTGRIVRTQTGDGTKRDMNWGSDLGKPDSWYCNGERWDEEMTMDSVLFWWDDPDPNEDRNSLPF